LHGRPEENHETPQTIQPVSGLRFETETLQIRSRSAIHSTTKFGAMHQTDNSFVQTMFLTTVKI
jgi:hypothetical protein